MGICHAEHRSFRLLVKKDDEEADAKTDLLQTAPESVASGKTIEGDSWKDIARHARDIRDAERRLDALEEELGAVKR